MDKVRLHDSPPPENSTKAALRAGCRGFTLLELSMVLVIIGLIVGGVLVGRDLISAAYVRSQITQTERFNTAVHAFQDRYGGYLPGDIPAAPAALAGLAPRGTSEGEGDGNGVIEGIPQPGQYAYGLSESGGETLMFWKDLSAANMIPGSFTLASSTTSINTSFNMSAYFPAAAIGPSNYVFVYSNGGVNYFCVEALAYVTYYPWTGTWGNNGGPYGLTPAQAFAIDTKIDDGLPNYGKVTVQFVQGSGLVWSPTDPNNEGYVQTATVGNKYAPLGPNYPSASIPGTCMDNANVEWANMQYSVSQNGSNCTLSFQFQ